MITWNLNVQNAEAKELLDAYTAEPYQNHILVKNADLQAPEDDLK